MKTWGELVPGDRLRSGAEVLLVDPARAWVSITYLAPNGATMTVDRLVSQAVDMADTCYDCGVPGASWKHPLDGSLHCASCVDTFEPEEETP